MLIVLLNLWLEMGYIFLARNGVYFSRMYSPIGRSAQFCRVLADLRFLYVILDLKVLIEGQHGSCITEICIVTKMRSMLLVSCWL